jgi:hypothetical protein
MRCGTTQGSDRALPVKIKIISVRSPRVEVKVKKRREWWQEFIPS